MGTTTESTTMVTAARVARQAASTEEWWTALSFEDNLALEPDPLLTPADRTVEEIELRLYSI